VLSDLLIAIVLSDLLIAIVLSDLLIAIVLSDLLRFTDSDYPFVFFKLFCINLTIPMIRIVELANLKLDR
jgi:hypothetical protein